MQHIHRRRPHNTTPISEQENEKLIWPGREKRFGVDELCRSVIRGLSGLSVAQPRSPAQSCISRDILPVYELIAFRAFGGQKPSRHEKNTPVAYAGVIPK